MIVVIVIVVVIVVIVIIVVRAQDVLFTHGGTNAAEPVRVRAQFPPVLRARYRTCAGADPSGVRRENIPYFLCLTPRELLKREIIFFIPF